MKSPLATLAYPFAHEFVRDHYSTLYLMRQITEENVQDRCLDGLLGDLPHEVEG